MSESIRLFDGKTLDGWGITGNPESWEVDDGCIHCKALKGKYLYTERNDFRDFELSLSFKHDPGANSGVFFRWTDLENPVQTGIEIQILDTHGKEPATVKCSGALYDCKAPIRNTCKPAGEWNDLGILCHGERIRITLNGKVVTDARMEDHEELRNRFRKGYIGLSAHSPRTVEYRNVRLREILGHQATGHE